MINYLTSRPRRLLAGALTVGVMAAVAMLGASAGPAAAAPAYSRISGAGSTWSELAIREWRANVSQFGITVDYNGVGSSEGRAQFAAGGQVNFGVSEIPYNLQDQAGTGDTPPKRKFAYMPIVAGGTAFMYHIKINGKLVTNLRLSGETLVKIFTQRIRKWNDSAIKADNPGLNLPARTIVPVVRSDGSGTTAQFTSWMSKVHAGAWNAWCVENNRKSPCGLTSYYPYPNNGTVVAQAKSENVAGYVASGSGEGAITYVEYAYAKKARFPVAKVLNSQGYYVEPTASNVAVGLTKAEINKDLTQILDKVYRHTDKRAYPLSSYSYMLVPTALEQGITESKGYTLAAFATYFLCEGQRSVDSLGYSPLPKNLVQEGFKQVKRIPGSQHVKNVEIAKCNNPTFSPSGENLLAKNAPYPPECDRKGGPSQCSTGTGGATQETTTRGGGTGGGATTPGGATAGPGATAASPGAGGAVIDPETGQVVGQAGPGGGGSYIDGVPVALEGEGGFGLRSTLMALSGLLFGLLIILPPIVGRLLRTRNAGGN